VRLGVCASRIVYVLGPTAHTNAGDVMENAIWASDIRLPDFPALTQELKTDVLIIGGGMAGLLCAWKLKQAGIDYALIEADRICRGITRNTTAKLTSQHGYIYRKLLREFGAEKAKLYWQANEAAIREYAKLAQDIDCDLERLDNVIYSTDSPETAQRELEALQKLGIPGEYTDQLPLPLPVAGAVRFRHQAQFHPLKLVKGISEDLRIFERTAVREFAGNTVLTNRGRITADRIIAATHFPILNKHGAYFLKMYQQRSYVLALEDGPKLPGMYLDGGGDGLSFRCWGSTLLLGGGGHRTGKQGGGWKELEAFARKHYPEARMTHRWAAQDCMTLDGVPYIGSYSSRTPGLYVATGFNKWGMTSAMVSAMLLSELVQGKNHPWEALFSPNRSILRPQLLVNAVESTVNLLTPTAPRCPHLGCALKWNAQEHSWDCPCHGSRFTEEGTLLDNPATGDLKKTPEQKRDRSE